MNRSGSKSGAIVGMLILTLSVIWSHDVSSQDCPSLLPGNLHAAGEGGLSWGIELRSFLYGVRRYDQETQKLQNKGYAFVAADIITQGEFGDHLFWLGEGVVRHWRNSEDFFCRFGEEGVYFTLKQAFVEWTPGDFLVRIGRQNFAYGNGLVLNHWFDGFELNWKTGKFQGSFFGGILAVDAARACQRKAVVEHLSCWKNFCSSNWGEQTAFGGFLSARWFGRQRVSMMIMRQNDENPGGLSRSAVYAGLFLRGSLIKGFGYFGEIAMQRPDEISTIMDNTWGLSFLIQKLWKTKWGGVQSRWGILYGSGKKNAVFSPLFERIRWGERMHFNAHHGLIVGLKHQWIPRFTRRFEGQLDYFKRFDRNSLDPISDELDAGLMLKMTENKRFWLVYSVLNLSNRIAMTHQFKFEMRFIL